MTVLDRLKLSYSMILKMKHFKFKNILLKKTDRKIFVLIKLILKN